MFDFYIDDEVISCVVGLIVGILLTILISVLVFKGTYSVVYIDVNGNKYVSSDVKEIDGDYYYKNADNDLVKIEFYENDFE